MSSQENRRRLLAAAEDHRVAAARWSEIVGDVSVDWALEHHEEITAAARLRDDIHSIGQLSSVGRGRHRPTTRPPASRRRSWRRLVQARNLGTHQESFPVILDDPFTGLAAHVKPALLELLPHRRLPAAILLTDDEDVASWARLEALAGELTIIEPTPARLPDAPRRHSSMASEGRVPELSSRICFELGRSFLATRSGFADPALTGCGCSAWRTSQLHQPLDVASGVTSSRCHRAAGGGRGRGGDPDDLQPRGARFDGHLRPGPPHRSRTAWSGCRPGPVPTRSWSPRTATGRSCGFASLSPYRERPAYSTTVEDSVYVDPAHQGRGRRPPAPAELVGLATAHGFHSVMARIVGGHAASIALHQACGFEIVGTEREVGRKFRSWLDVVVMQRMLS